MSQHELSELQTLWIESFHNQNTSDRLNQLFVASGYDGPKVYKHSRQAQLKNHLMACFPWVRRFVSDDFWAGVCMHYVKATPSLHADINLYGDSLADFLTRFTPTQNITGLSELCRLEWAWYRLSLCQPVNTFDFENFHRLQSHQLQQLKFKVNPSLVIISSEIAVYDLWKLNLRPQQATINVDNPQSVAIYLKFGKKHIELLSDQDESILRELMSEPYWAQFCSRKNFQNDTTLIQEILQKFIHQQWITEYMLGSGNEKNNFKGGITE